MTKTGRSRRSADGRDIPAAWFEPAIHTSYFRIFSKVLEERGLPTPRAPAGQPRLLPMIDFLPSFDAISAVTQPLSGIELGLAIPGAAHGLMGMSAISSATILDALHAIARYVRVRNGLFVYHFVEDEGFSMIELTPRLELRDYERFLEYAASIAIFNIFRTISEPLTLKHGFIRFPWPAPANLDSVNSAMSRCFHFGESKFCMGFPTEVARRPAPTADPDLHRRLTSAAEDELKRISGNMAARIRQLINANAPHWPTLDEVASQLALSKRTLARRLSAENVAYQDLIDEARSELACWYLRQTVLPIGAIVERTGFSEISNFSRGFKRLHGMSPSEYRSRFRATPGE